MEFRDGCTRVFSVVHRVALVVGGHFGNFTEEET